jgi:dynamin 1-like protein
MHCSRFGGTTLDTPTFILIGGQGAGKSTVAKFISKYDISPIGSGLVTRVPVIIKLISLPSEHDDSIYLTIGDEKQKVSARDVHGLIQKETVRLVGDKNTVANKPIVVEIYSSNVMDMTVIDLPPILFVKLLSNVMFILESNKRSNCGFI